MDSRVTPRPASTAQDHIPVSIRTRTNAWQENTRGRVRIHYRGARAWSRSLRGAGALPTFLLIGAQRCGTTSMYRNLAGHPQIREPLGKELQYFSINWNRSLSWYAGHFPTPGAGEQTFEASPYYLFDPQVPERVAATIPDVRVIALLRNPVDRAYSHYLHSVRLGGETLSFEDAIAAEDERMDKTAAMGTDSPEWHRTRRLHSYIARGRYAGQIERWREHVDPRRMLLLKSEDFYSRPEAVFAEVTRFLDLPPFVPERFAARNRHPAWQPSAMEPVVRDRLTQHFAEEQARVVALTGWQTGWF